MESQKENVQTAQNGKTTPKPETAVKTLPVATGKPEVKEPTPEELKKVIADLTKKLSVIPQEFEKRIEYFNQKKEQIRRLAVLDNDSEILNSHLEALSTITTANEFENEEYFLNIEGGNKYNKKAIYSLKNPMIIGELLVSIISRIDRKREELRKQIEA